MTAAPLRVLQVFEPADGGVPEHVRLLAAGLADRGHAVLVAGRPDASPRAWLESRGIAYAPLPLSGRVPDPVEDRRAYRALTGLLDDGAYDLVHAHGQKAGLLARLAAKRRRLPSVYTPHSFVYRTQALRPRLSGRLRFRVGLLAERRLARHTAVIVAVAENERRVALEDRVAPAERIVVVHPGIDVDPAARPDDSLRRFRGDGPLLGFVAGLREQKGLPVLLESLEILARRGTPVRFAIVGNGPLREQVAARVDEALLAETTMLAPFEGGAARYLAALDAFVLPSLWEGLPMAVLEAMACGLPVVASSVDGTPEAVEDGVTGFLVPPGDPDALAERIDEIATHPARRLEMGEAARRAASTRFGAGRMVDALIAVYRSALAAAEPAET